jgi:transposase-like protein
MGIFKVECTIAWEWFLTTLRDDFSITNTSPWTIMSDRHKGLINVMEKVFLDVDHRFCVSHLIQISQKQVIDERH